MYHGPDKNLETFDYLDKYKQNKIDTLGLFEN